MKEFLLIIFSFSIISFPQIRHLNLPKCAEISLSDVVLQDTISSRVVLGADNIIPYQKNPPFEFKFFNRHKTQKLTCTFMPGDYLYSISEFKIEMNVTDAKHFTVDSSQVKIVVLNNILVFKSGKGIELGIDSSTIVTILGKPGKILEENGVDIFLYEIKNPIYYPNEKIENQTYDFFKLFDMPSYYGNYKFRNGKLVEFAFGFPYF